MTREEYLRDMVRLWLGLPAGAEVPPLPDHLAARLLRDEERASHHRDQWGCWEFGFSDAHHRGALLVPEIDQWLADRRAAGCGGTPMWPDGHGFALAVSHDVDDLSHHVTPAQWARVARLRLAGRGGVKGRLRALAEGLPVTAWQALAIRPAPDLAATVERALDIEAELGIAASWFFTVWPISHASPYDCTYDPDDPCTFRGRRATVAEVIRAVAQAGHDVGLHGSYPTAADGDALAAEKARLERVLGRTVASTRQHWLHWLVDETPGHQAAAGLMIDGTLGFNGSAGFRAGTSLPFPSWPSGILEIPLTVMDAALFRPGAMGLDLDLAVTDRKSVV